MLLKDDANIPPPGNGRSGIEFETLTVERYLISILKDSDIKSASVLYFYSVEVSSEPKQNGKKRLKEQMK